MTETPPLDRYRAQLADMRKRYLAYERSVQDLPPSSARAVAGSILNTFETLCDVFSDAVEEWESRAEALIAVVEQDATTIEDLHAEVDSLLGEVDSLHAEVDSLLEELTELRGGAGE